MLAALGQSGLVGPVKARSQIGNTILRSQAPTQPGLTLRMGPNQTANIFSMFNSAGTNLLQLSAAGTLTVSQGISTGANITGNSDIRCASGGHYQWLSRSGMRSPSDGVIGLYNNADTDFGRLQFGGTTSSFPALGRSTVYLSVLLADGTDGGGIQMSEGANFDLGTTTGTKLGISASAKLGLWSATPVVQPTAVADASGGAVIDAECRTALNALLSRLRTIGAIAT